MNRLLAFSLLATALASAQNSAPKRPRITGIDHVEFYTTNADANDHLFTVVLGLMEMPVLESGETQRFRVGGQWVGYRPAPDPKSTNRMDHLAFRTADCAGLRAYLASNGIHVPESVVTGKDGTRSFTVSDPEEHRIEFVQRPDTLYIGVRTGRMSDPISRRIIHVGFVVHDRAAEDHFYKDILGFHIYWYGGMKDNQTDWVAMQVPDGTDWLEYMLGIGPDADQHTTGVMNHVSLGVRDMKQTQAKLESRGWKPHGNEKMQMGRDGKWQLNLYDPDFTRVELMEFKPVQKPCCSDFQGPQPTE